jgi:hypothetical protein
VEYDRYGPSPRDYSTRLRHAFVEWTSRDGSASVRAGQDWSLFADPEAYAPIFNPLPLGTIFVRQPQVRLSYHPGPRLTVSASLEGGRGDLAVTGGSLIAEPFSGTPDVAISAGIAEDCGGVKIAALVRHPGTGNIANWGASLSGRLRLRGKRRQLVRLQATYSNGIARYVGEFGTRFERHLQEDSPAGNSAQGRVFAANASYERYLTERFSMTILGSHARAEARSDAIWSTKTVSALVGNVAFHPDSRLDLALEFMIASREEGRVSATRGLLRFASRFRF